MTVSVQTGSRGVFRPAPQVAALPLLRSTKVLDQLRERICLLHYSRRTEEAYVHWRRAFIRFHGIRHPLAMGGPEVEAFLGWLAGEHQVSASTHKQALSALLFLYTKVLGVQLPWLNEVGRPRVQRRLPVVVSKEELSSVFRRMDSEHRLFAQLLYGTGMRLLEGLQLRVKDVDFAHRALIVRAGKGGKDRCLMLPERLVGPLQAQLASARELWWLTRRTARPVWTCRMHWSASTHGRARVGSGSGSSRRPPIRRTRALA